MFLLAAPQPPPQVTLKPTFEIRERIERRTNRDFNDSVDDNKSDLMSRFRVGVNFNYGKDVSGRVQYRYGHDWVFKESGESTVERTDVDQAFISVKNGKATITVGRQQVPKGAQKILGGGEFGNTSKTWDGLRYTNERLDLFAGKVAVDSALYPDAYGAFASYKSKLGETTFVAKQDEATVGDIQIYALDHRYVGKFGRWTVTGEAVGETGHSSNKDLEAWAGHLMVDYKIDKKWSAFVMGNVASGGSSAKKTQTFDQLFAANHSNYGQMEMQGWRNMQHLAFALNYKPDKKLDVGLQYHFFELYDSKDGWYGAGGSLNKRVGGSYIDAAGGRGRDIGQEIELCGNYALSSNYILQFGIAKFLPGGYVKSFNGSDSADQYWMYAGITCKF